MFVATKHAEIRLRQRGIPAAIVEWLVSYGSSHFDHHRGLLFYFDSRSRAVLRSVVARAVLARYSEHLDCYAVMSTDGEVVTVGAPNTTVQARLRSETSKSAKKALKCT